ncbi:hypothetical protein ES705_42931 [subsurface metagenome]
MPIKLGKKKYFLVKDLEKILPYNAFGVREILRKGLLRGRRMGKYWIVKKEDLEIFLEGSN